MNQRVLGFPLATNLSTSKRSRYLQKEDQRYVTTRIISPTRIQAAGNKPKLIDEYIGRINSQDARVSIAHMRSPEGWEEPGQTPEFDEYTIVLKGTLRVTSQNESLDIVAGQAVIASKGEWVRYSTPASGGAEYIAVCVPAFSTDTVHRDGVDE